jgi:hypothetical protein
MPSRFAILLIIVVVKVFKARSLTRYIFHDNKILPQLRRGLHLKGGVVDQQS